MNELDELQERIARATAEQDIDAQEELNDWLIRNAPALIEEVRRLRAENERLRADVAKLLRDLLLFDHGSVDTDFGVTSDAIHTLKLEVP